MLASGQMIFDVKNDFNRKKHTPAHKEAKLTKTEAQLINSENAKQSELIAEKSTTQNEKTRQNLKPSDNPSIAPPQDHTEENFKNVRHHLKLNQSAMTTDKEQVADQKFSDLADKSDSVLLKVGTVWPFTLFVNKIIIDPFKVNVVFKEFFWSEHIHSIMVKDILDVVVETSLFFATVKIVDQGYVTNTVDIAYLKRSDAMMVRKIIQGLVIAHRQSVDLSVLKTSHIREKAEELGKVKGIDKESAAYTS